MIFELMDVFVSSEPLYIKNISCKYCNKLLSVSCIFSRPEVIKLFKLLKNIKTAKINEILRFKL